MHLTDETNSRPELVLPRKLGNLVFNCLVYTWRCWSRYCALMDHICHSFGPRSSFFLWPSIAHPSGLETSLADEGIPWPPVYSDAPSHPYSLLAILISLCNFPLQIIPYSCSKNLSVFPANLHDGRDCICLVHPYTLNSLPGAFHMVSIWNEWLYWMNE